MDAQVHGKPYDNRWGRKNHQAWRGHADRGRRQLSAGEVRYIRCRAARHDDRIVAIGQLVLFSTDTGGAWLLDRNDQLAARLARDGEAERVHFLETDTTFTIEWKGSYRLDGPAFVYSDNETCRVVTIIGYPTDEIADAPPSGNFKELDLSSRGRRRGRYKPGALPTSWFTTTRPVKRLKSWSADHRSRVRHAGGTTPRHA